MIGSGTVIGNYRIVQKLGAGGMGAVYAAVDLMLERTVALKLLRPEFAGDQELAERFRTEAVILARLNHPNIATLYGLFREGDQLFMVMEFVRGETLEHMVERQGPLPPVTAARWCCQVLDAMEYAHRRGVVHRDIKPANLMVTEEGSIKVMDFGIARLLGSAHQTKLGHVIGTVSYMAPEQIRGQEVDGRTDLYALGIVLYDLVTGQTPFRGSDEFAIMTAQVSQAPLPPSRLVRTLPTWLEDAILKTLAKRPADRFASALEFRRALDTGLKTVPPQDDTGALPIVAAELQIEAAAPHAPTAASDSPRIPDSVPSRTPPPAAQAGPEQALELIPETRLEEADEYETLLPAPETRPAETPREGPAAAAPRETRLAAETPPTRLPGATTGPAGLLSRLTWRHVAAMGALVVVFVALPVLWLALRHPSPSPAGDQRAAESRPSQPAQAPGQQPAPQQQPDTAVAVPPIDVSGQKPSVEQPPGSGRTPIGQQPQPPATREPAGPADKPKGVLPSPPAAPPDTKAAPEGRSAATEEPRPGSGEPVSFDGLQMVVKETSEVDAVLNLFPDRLTIVSEDSGAVLKTMRYRSIVSAVYEETHQTGQQKSGGLGALKGALSKGGQLFGAGKHWLTVRTDDDTAVVRLGRSYKDVLPAFEKMSGIKVKGR